MNNLGSYEISRHRSKLIYFVLSVLPLLKLHKFLISMRCSLQLTSYISYSVQVRGISYLFPRMYFVCSYVQIVVQNNSCDGLLQSCPPGPITENRTSMCACQSVNCSWGTWGNWSKLCGMVNRTRHIVQTQTTIQAESCDGVPTQCNQQPENEYNKLPDCKYLYH